MANPKIIEGMDALDRLRSAEPPQWLSPSEELSRSCRAAAEHLFSSLIPFCPKTPLERLLVSEDFDAEQIWHQIELQSKTLIPTLRREIGRLERSSPEEVLGVPAAKKEAEGAEDEALVEEKEGFEPMSEGEGDDDEEESEDDEDEGGEEDDEEEEEERKTGGEGGVEDGFLDIKELKEYCEEEEAKEYGYSKKKKKRSERDEDGEEEEEEEEDDDEELEGLDADGDEDEDDFGNLRYEDFFGGKKKKKPARERDPQNDREDMSSDDDEKYDGDIQDHEEQPLSTYEKQLEKIQSKIEQLEKANLEPKSWTMQGEVTASKRPKNSALEVDLDFEHNARPPPVITEEVTASLEDLIKKRILEGHFDDVERAPKLPSKAPVELRELDENKSKKGLAELYEEEYVQKTGLASAPLSLTDEQKEEASGLFKRLCLKLDALSHFHFTPKPVIEDLSIQANVPALAMEEIAPLAVSDATMLAPEEVFAGKGDIKEEAELTKADRKRRRANKKRKFKAENAKHTTKKSRDSNHSNGTEE
ncbi:hypothetical protein QJS10_CPA03g00359 [Acorus calamus]|uniref:U3 small nucleolar ribonucleoprotein protein MPP10 n=1 Tax=Acorus calamus TaxID=4465 RepID=A0AAV9F5S0_ACOCL|nr:hypothetical protein QJS10_CPA03g00359 [Acorus calamus]